MKAPEVNLSAGGMLALVGLVAAAYLVWKGPQILKGAADLAGQAVDAVNPLNHDNAIATGVNAVGGAIVTEPDGPGKNADGSWSLGGWWYDVWNPDKAQSVRDMTKPVNTGGATGSW